MSDWRTYYWRFFNIAVRCVGVGFVVVGGIFAIWGLSLVLDPKATIDVNGVPSSDPWIKGMTLVVGLVVCVLGVLLVFARPYRPDLESSNGKNDDLRPLRRLYDFMSLEPKSKSGRIVAGILQILSGLFGVLLGIYLFNGHKGAYFWSWLLWVISIFNIIRGIKRIYVP